MAVTVKERYSKRLKLKTYSYEIDFTEPTTKERIRETDSGYTTKTEAKTAGRKREIELKNKISLGFKNKKIKFSKFIVDWLNTIKPQLANSTWTRYKIAVDKILLPSLGDKYLDKIKPSDINAIYLHCINDLGNSTTTIRQYHWILSKAFKNALKWKIIDYDIMTTIDPPKKAKRELTVYNKDQLFLLLDRIKNLTCYMPVLLSSTTGIRLGELCALRWKDVNLKDKEIYITRQLQKVDGKLELLELKTSTSKRKIPLLDYTIKGLEGLKQIQEYNKSKNKNYDKRNFVICKEDGSPYEPNYISKNYTRVMKQYRACKELKIPYIRFHDLRHTYATMLLTANTNPKVVSELMGHSTVSMTLNTYSHVLPSLKENAINKLENLLFPGDKNPQKE
ncbi:tyrosine-type recombinase/integrase [Clostridium tyrobutyricum]|uniref:tyrosine-type recombinase/integrase n=1 Tax=Clostridium tyrobutyricum TaxID=1519 RepID=UPI001C3813CB|nr:site-specific integrase [Clostridium tyrobutyricum]MBV4429404.1 site-specific integrase [Clostridium tyrobutyricum]MBV4443031.1 site-specific integrase [Clostridium tyrobutyricum]